MSDLLLKTRIVQLKKADSPGKCVLYVMSRDQRVADNHALLCAQKHALAKGLPLAVVFCLYPKSGYRAREHYEFMLTGLQEVETSLKNLNIPFMMVIGEPKEKLLAAAHHLEPDAVYFDFNPLRGPKKLQTVIALKIPSAVFVVDTHNIVPTQVVSTKQEIGAYTIRPKIHKLLGAYLTDTETIKKHPYSWPGSVQSLAAVQKHTRDVLTHVPSNATQILWQSGESHALQHLETFITTKLERYAVDRNDPSTGAQSDLSPYLHFGQLSSLRVALRLREESLKRGNDLHFLSSPKMPKPEEAKTTYQHGIDSLIEEMIVRKELADNYCLWNNDYDSLNAAPHWAQASLDAHRMDERHYVYTYEELRDAKTHDQAWNAAQTQLLKTGKMHGYMRMYWAKKVLEWTESPEQAIDYLIQLNDHYSIDGGDPNGYAGILWSIGGVHDRPWQERPIFGVIRYMNYEGLKRKFDIGSYEKTWLGEAQ